MTTFKLGHAQIWRVEEMTIRSPMSTLTSDQALLDANSHWLRPLFLNEDGTRDFVFQSWIVTVDSTVIVIDPCNGNGRKHPLALFNNLDTPYLERFAATGIRPEDVDIVFCTHLHHDHCGWSTRLKSGRFIPTFPTARYIYVRRELERWRNPPPLSPQGYDLNVGVFDHSVRPIFDAGLATLADTGQRLTESIVIDAAHGHTAGHSMLHLTSAAQHAFFTGDVFHHPLQLLYPELHMPGDDDRVLAIRTRKRILALCMQNDALILPAHFPRPYAGYVRSRDAQLLFQPIGT